jgi:phosphohistidine phosphatase
MREAGHHPALILCSTAKRTRETVDAILNFLPAKTLVQYTRALYLAAPERMLALLYEDGQDAPSIMLVGHNPGMEQLALLLAREDGGAAERVRRAQLAEKFPTAALAVLRFAIDDWSDVRPGTGALEAFVRPRDIAE